MKFNRGDTTTFVQIILLLVGMVVLGFLLGPYYQESLENNGEIPDENVTDGDTDFPRDVEISTVSQGAHGGYEERGALVIRDANTWAGLWGKIDSSDTPIINFDEEIAIAVFFGKKSTGGHTIKITKVTEEANRIVATVLETSPGSACIVTQGFTSPYHIVKIKRTEKEIEFVSEAKVVEC